MNVFVVHCGCDRNIVQKQVVASMDSLEKRANLLVMASEKKLWKRNALQMIRQAQMVLFVVGKTSCSNPNVGWELRQAIRLHKKIYYYKLDQSFDLHPDLNGTDRFTKKVGPLGDQVHSMEELAAIIRKHENGDYDIFNTELDAAKDNELLEQYRLFLETSERLVERRQAVNNFYLSANTAIFSVVAIMISLMEKDRTEMLSLILLAFILLAVVGIVLCISWVNILESYGTLNGCKMKVISIIERRLPISLFDSEWKVMGDKLNSKRYVSFTDSEKRLPKLFIALYILLIIVCILAICIFC
nr:hypothetical protein [Clostridia bacterium]